MTTEHELSLAATVLDLVRRPADFDALELLHDLTAYAVDLLPVRSAGVTVLTDTGQVAYVTASDETCRELEQDQIDLNEGPCLDSALAQEPLPLTSLTEGSGATRWPRFAPRARAAGITAVAAVILRTPHAPLGAVNLLMAEPPYATVRDLRLTETLADATATTFAHQRELRAKDRILAQLQNALDSRVVIEQAKGVLAARLDVSMDEAFARLRGHARARQHKLTDVAERIAGGDLPDEFVPAR